MSKKFIKILLFFLIFIFCFSLSSVAFAQDSSYEITLKDKVILTQPAVCYITTYYYAYVYDAWYDEWSELYYYGPLGGTGFCVNSDSGHIVTAGHVVDVSKDEIKYAIIEAYIYDYYDNVDTFTDADWNNAFNTFRIEGENGPDPDEEVWVQFNTATGGLPDSPNENYIRAAIIDFSPWEQRDIAVLKITPVTGNALSSTIIGDSSMIEVQDSITIIGYPWNADISDESIMTPSVVTGTVSARKMVGGTEVLQVNMTAAPGNSGSPVLNENGEVIGMLTMGTTENVNFLRPSNDIKEMLNKNGVTNKHGMLDEELKKGLAAFRGKHYSAAIDNFNAVLNLSQRHLLAQEYRAKAQEAVNRGEDIPLVEEKEEVKPAEEETEPAEGEEAKEAKETEEAEEGGIPDWGIFLIVLAVGFVFIIIIVVLIILVVRKKGKKPEAAAAPTEAKEEPKKGISKDSKEKIKYCPSCGKEVGEDRAFCSNCGAKLK